MCFLILVTNFRNRFIVLTQQSNKGACTNFCRQRCREAYLCLPRLPRLTGRVPGSEYMLAKWNALYNSTGSTMSERDGTNYFKGFVGQNRKDSSLVKKIVLHQYSQLSIIRTRQRIFGAFSTKTCKNAPDSFVMSLCRYVITGQNFIKFNHTKTHPEVKILVNFTHFRE